MKDKFQPQKSSIIPIRQSDIKRVHCFMDLFTIISLLSEDLNLLPKHPKLNAPLERLNRLVYNILVTKYLIDRFFDYIYLLVGVLSYISWVIIYFLRHTL